MTSFFVQLIIFVVGLNVAKDLLVIVRKWAKELIEAIDPDNIKQRRKAEELRKQLENDLRKEKEN